MLNVRAFLLSCLAIPIATVSSAQFVSSARHAESLPATELSHSVSVNELAKPLSDASLQWRLQHALDSVYALTSEDGRYGVTASVIVPGQQWSGTTGISEANVPMRPDHLVEVGSNTKSFIAATILELEQEGKLAITDRISLYLPSIAQVDSTITIKELLEHSSGVYDYLNDDTNATLLTDAYVDHPTHQWKPEEILATIGAPNFQPGKSYHYSNTGYILLGMLIERVTSHPVAEELRNRFFSTQQMDHTFAGSDEVIHGEFAHQWFPATTTSAAWDLGTIDHTAQLSLAWTAGYLVATPTDLVRWADALYRGKILTPGSMTKMLHMNTWPDGTHYGLGTVQAAYGAKRVLGHSGRLPGFNSVMYAIPRDSVALVIVTNSDELQSDPSINDYVLALFAGIYRPVKSHVSETLPLRAYQIEAGRTLRIEYSGDMMVEPVIRVYDVLGRAYTLRGASVSNGLRFDLTSLPHGAYTYDIQSAGGHQFGRIFRR